MELLGFCLFNIIVKWKYQDKYRSYSDLLALFGLGVSMTVQNAYTFHLHWQHIESSVCQGHLNLCNIFILSMKHSYKKLYSYTSCMNDFQSKCTQLIVCYSDPYVKVSLMCEGRRLKKRKTTTKKNTLNPVYNEAIIFDIPPENVDQVSLSITVMDYDR